MRQLSPSLKARRCVRQTTKESYRERASPKEEEEEEARRCVRQTTKESYRDRASPKEEEEEEEEARRCVRQTTEESLRLSMCLVRYLVRVSCPSTRGRLLKRD